MSTNRKSKLPAFTVIPVEIFNIDVGVFATELDRHAVLEYQGCSDLDVHSDAALSSAHCDFADDGTVRMSMVIKEAATDATLAHECVHIADFIMDHVGVPMDVENTELRAYLVGHLFSHAQEARA